MTASIPATGGTVGMPAGDGIPGAAPVSMYRMVIFTTPGETTGTTPGMVATPLL